jgi:trigger factor
LSQTETCKRTLEISVPAEEVQSETDRVVAAFQAKVRLPGFRPGKAPKSIVLSRFQGNIRQQVLENLIPKHLGELAKKENLNIVGTPGVTDVQYAEGEPLRFKVELEVAPEFELGDYKGLSVPYRPPEVSAQDIDKRIEELRERHAEYVNIDPRPVENGDYAVVSLKSIAGVEGEPIEQEETVIHVGGPDTMASFSDALLGREPGAETEVEITYPDDYVNRRLAGRTVKFLLTLRGLRRKELPEVDDEFAKEVGDYKDLAELRDELRKQILREREFMAQEEAKHKLVEALVDAHQFPVPEAFVEQQLRGMIEQRMRDMALQGVDPRTADVDWSALKASLRSQAERDVRASLILERIADREAIQTLVEDVDRELQRIAKQLREPVAAVRKRFEEDGTIRRIALQIRTEKVLNFLFDQSRKVAAEQPPGQA